MRTFRVFRTLWPVIEDTKRPPRRLPTLWRIVEYSASERGYARFPENRLWWIGEGEPYCFGCGVVIGWMYPDKDLVAEVPEQLDDAQACEWLWNQSGLDRAHLIDRCLGGLDIPANLVPLCTLCHYGGRWGKAMPSFAPGEEELALEWVKRHESFEEKLMRAYRNDPRVRADMSRATRGKRKFTMSVA